MVFSFKFWHLGAVLHLLLTFLCTRIYFFATFGALINFLWSPKRLKCHFITFYFNYRHSFGKRRLCIASSPPYFPSIYNTKVIKFHIAHSLTLIQFTLYSYPIQRYSAPAFCDTRCRLLDCRQSASMLACVLYTF